MKLFTRICSVLALVAAALAFTSTAQAQFNPSTNPPALTLYVGQSVTLSVEGYEPSGLTPYTLDRPLRCVSTQFEYWASAPSAAVVTSSHTNSTITLTAVAAGTTNVGANYLVADCYGNQTDLNALISVTVVAQPEVQNIDGDTLLYFTPSAPTN